MKHKKINQSALSSYNKVVFDAYFKILKVAKVLLSTIEQEDLRHTLIREEQFRDAAGVLHEFVNPLIYLRLECNDATRFVIHYGFEQVNDSYELSNPTACFTRVVYQLTSKALTTIDIEDSVSTEWCITVCSQLYEYIEEQPKYHTFQLIKHKVTQGQRKRILKVA